MDYNLLLRVYVWIASIIGTLTICVCLCAVLVYGLTVILVRRAANKAAASMIAIAELKRELGLNTTPADDTNCRNN